MRPIIQLLLTALLAFAPLSLAHAQGKSAATTTMALPVNLPKPVQEVIDRNAKECEAGEKPVYRRGFLSTRDINADGKPDYVLDYDRFACGERAGMFCGSGGCQTEIFASDGEGGYVQVWDKLAQKVEFKTIDKRPALVIHLHGSKCGRNNDKRCALTLYWNGEEFNPAN